MSHPYLIPSVLCALAITISSGMIATGCSNPVLTPVDTFVNRTYCVTAESAIDRDSTIAPELKTALQTELKAMRRLLDVALDREPADSEVAK